MKKLLALFALIFATAAPATSLVRISGDFAVGYPCTLADGTKFVCPVATLTDSSGNAYTLQTDTNGALVGPKAGTADRVVTKTNLSANTSTQICPTATNPIATEIFFTTAGVGISLAGGTLTQATVGTTASTTPDWYQNAANTDWLSPAAITNAITAYGAAGIVTCIQWIRQ